MQEPEKYLEQQQERLPDDFVPFRSSNLNFPLQDLTDVKQLLFNSTGNFSTLQLAKYQGQKVVIKEISFEEGNEHYAFVEMALLMNLRNQVAHTHVMDYLGAAKINDKIFMINEYLERGDIRQALKHDVQFFKQDIHPTDLDFVWKQRIRVANHISAALKSLHELSIVHRDIKSENIFLTGRGRKTVMKLGDFGMARGIHSVDEDEARTYTICGTDELMAPEMLLALPYDHSVDIFSFGLVLAEVICGRGPSPMFNRQEADYEFLPRSPEDSFDLNLDEISSYALAGCPVDLIDLCKQCLSYESRYRITAEELSEMVMELDKELNLKKAERVKSKVAPRKWIFDQRRGSYRAGDKSSGFQLTQVKSMFDLVHEESTPEMIKKNIEQQISLDISSDMTAQPSTSKHSKNQNPANVARRQLRQINRKLDRIAILKEESPESVESEPKSDSNLTHGRKKTNIGRRVQALQNRFMGTNGKTSEEPQPQIVSDSML